MTALREIKLLQELKDPNVIVRAISLLCHSLSIRYAILSTSNINAFLVMW